MKRNPSAEERIRRAVEAWFITEPLLFAAFLTHRLAARPGASTLRIGDGRVEYNPAFIEALPPRVLEEVLRLEAVRILAEAGIPVGVNVAPVVPGLTDEEMPGILEAAAEAGAQFASYILLRLPWGVKDIFETWLEQHFPDRKDRVLNRVRGMRGGKLYDGRFAVRGKGEGKWAEQLESLFRVTRRKLDLERRPELSTASFRVPPDPNDPQTDLFGPSTAA